MKIQVLENGPIIVEAAGFKVALCRCGQSDNKPFCDGNHKACEFKAKAHLIELKQEPDNGGH